MAETPPSTVSMPLAAADEASHNEEVPVHALKTLLQRAEQRLTGLTPPQAHPPRLPVNAPPNRCVTWPS